LLAIANILNTIRIRNQKELIKDLREAHWTHVYATNAIQRKLEESIEARDRLAMRVSDLEVAVEVNTTKIEERIGKDIADVTEFCERRIDSLVEDVRALQLWKIEASELIEAHAELEKEAANSERLFQEGLSNLLNYGVDKK
jgi:hypothetical protein